jgi:hypothetical protein
MLKLKRIKRIWDAGISDIPLPQKFPPETRATFVAPEWTSKGWSENSPGFAWWFTHRGKCIFGESMIGELQADSEVNGAYATYCHSYAHRYFADKESIFERHAYHQVVVVDWSHGRFSTLIELAWKNGCGGYGGRSNWIADKEESPNRLYSAMPASMKVPWDCNKSEIRIFDMPCFGKHGIAEYLHKYSFMAGSPETISEIPKVEQRFLEPRECYEGEVRLRNLTPSVLAGFALNYVQNTPVYITLEPTRAANCQTFAADLFSFLCGRSDVKPCSHLVQLVYKRNLSFLYKDADSETTRNGRSRTIPGAMIREALCHDRRDS